MSELVAVPRDFLIAVDSELSAVAHGRPPQDAEQLYWQARKLADRPALEARIAELEAVPSSPDTDEVTGPPDRIYLCYGDICELDLPVSHVDCEEVTWSEHPPCDVVVEYVRVSALRAARARIAELEARPPSSPDTDSLRELAQDVFDEDHLDAAFIQAAAVTLAGYCPEFADALDASRAECARLRELACRAVEAFWGSDYVAKLRAMDALRGALGDGQ